MQPRFITLEGGEGAGKSTQLRLLSEAFSAAGIPHITTREPGGSAGAEAIRNLVVQGAVDAWNPATESLLFMAARFDHLAARIQPALAAGQWVLCDRFYDSTAIYQGVAKGVGVAWLDALYRQLFGTLKPDLTFWLDLSPEIGLARADARGNALESRFEQMDLAFHTRLREGFAARAMAEPQRIHRVDADQPPEAVQTALRTLLEARFGVVLG